MEFRAGSPFEVVTEVQDEPALFLTEEPVMGGSRIGLRRCVKPPPEELSEGSSSVEVSGESSENEEEEDDAVSSQGGRSLDSFSSSLEDSLPIKSGLSNHYKGKSKSFGNLMEASKKCNAKDLEKVESPLNKRRRLLIANKLRRRRSSLSSFSIYSKIDHPNSMPLLALQESSDQDDHEHNGDYDDSSNDQSSKLQDKRMKMTNNSNREFLVQRSEDAEDVFCLTSFHSLC